MLWALWIAAEGRPDTGILLVFLAGAVLMRSAGCAINDFADRHFDHAVARTVQRPLARGAIKPFEAVLIAGVLAALAFALVLTLNRLTVWLSVVGVVLAAAYPFAKRYTYLPQIVLGCAFAWAVPMAFAAQSGELQRNTWLLFIAAVLWAVVYDTMYAMADREDDIKIGLKSTAILFGTYDRIVIAGFQIATLSSLVLVGVWAQLSVPYFLSLIIGACLFDHEQFMIKHRQPKRCFAAFLHNHYFGLVVFLGIVYSYR